LREKRDTPEFKARTWALRRTPTYKKQRRAYVSTPEYAEKTRAWYRAYYNSRGGREMIRARHQQRKREVIDAYGGCCADCGEKNLDVLEMDHIKGGGAKERRALREQGQVSNNIARLHAEHRRTGRWLPGFAVRCHSCHVAKDRPKKA